MRDREPMAPRESDHLVEARTLDAPGHLLSGCDWADLFSRSSGETDRRKLGKAISPELLVALEALRSPISLVFLNELQVGRGLRPGFRGAAQAPVITIHDAVEDQRQTEPVDD